MGRIIDLGNGMNVGISIAEIKTIPHFTLINSNLDRANYSNYVFFSQLLNGLHRKSADGMTAFEIMFSSKNVTNQTYNAQVKMHFVIRQMGKIKEEIENNLGSFENSLKNEFSDNFFDMDFIHSDELYENYCEYLSSIDTSVITSVSKKEDEIISALSQNGYVYQTFITAPAESINISNID